jgi:glycosyltransferase involved in cell wall biosynthesis
MLRLRRTTDLARRRLRAQDRRTVAHVDSFAANSSAVRDRIRRFYQRDARVIFPPVDTEFYTPGAAPSRDFVLAVSRFIPYKRIDFAIEAAATARVRLVIAGSGPQEGELRRLARRAGGDVTFVISPTDEHLRELYRNALALVFPAHEDFGIVAVEAQACGTPVLALDAGGARDTVLAGVTGHRFAHHDARAFASALTSFADNPLDAAACRRHALGFSIERFKTELREWLADP